MIGIETRPVLGVPLVDVMHSPARNTDRKSDSPIECQLRTFAREVIERHRPDLLIVVERKGTAILRALRGLREDPLQWDWRKVVSSNEVDRLSPDLFRGRVLVFDDMMRGGHHVTDLLKRLLKRGLWNPQDERLRVAVFAVHEDSSRGVSVEGVNVPHYWFYRDLTQGAYQSIRSQIVAMLQAEGSLLLDTEHIEVRLKLHGNFNRLTDALRRRAKAIVFNSACNRTNITVYYPDDSAHAFPSGRFPPGADPEKTVTKCRINERERGEFAIIPMCYPTVGWSPQDVWPVRTEDARLLGKDAASPVGRFYGVGLLAALEVLRWVLRDISVLEEGEYSLSIPSSNEDACLHGGYGLEHLFVMYPTLNMNELVRQINEIAAWGASEGVRLRSVKFPSPQPKIYSMSELRKWATQLLQVIRYVIDMRLMQKSQEQGSSASQEHPFGILMRDIFDIGARLNLEEVVISALCDILIDQANLLTHCETDDMDCGRKRVLRTFEPDGEVVSELVRRYTTQWGLPNGW